MRSRALGVAMLGAGYIAEYHLTGLAAAGGACVRVIVGRTRERAQALAERFGVPDSSTDAAAALRRDDVDAVIIATPDDTHEALAIDAAVAGKAILLQKPMAGSVAAAQRIVDAARKHGVDLQVSFMHRFFDEVIEARRLLAEGTIGRVLTARIRNATPGPDWDAWFFRKERVPNGVVDQLGVHGIDVITQLLGRVCSVTARAHTALPSRRLKDGSIVPVETVDNAVAVYTLDDGVVVTHEMSMTEVAGCDRFRLELYGTHGTLWLRTERGRLAVFALERFGSQWQTLPLPDTPFGMTQHAAWLAGIDDPAAQLRTAEDALHGMRVVAAAMRSNAAHGAMMNVEDAVLQDAAPSIERRIA
jgi:predicted dehydrogenase